MPGARSARYCTAQLSPPPSSQTYAPSSSSGYVFLSVRIWELPNTLSISPLLVP
jgi:hypothetical protein